ncbi:hypothetical protein I3700191H1_00520 [Megasphaera massiliensis]|uniref:ESPR-type extended signal peptide-containing protein n=1 Tax=Megasphaera massiliensis TaxID=1232428 RepID=UPI0034BDA3B4
MNKQYKVIWSKVRHCYVVVSELAKRSGKTKSVKAQSCQKLAVTLTVLALSLGVTGMVGAANNTAGSGSGVAVGSGSSAEFDTSVAVGQNATATLANSTAIGQGATVSQSASGGTAIGQGATVNVSGGVALGAGSVANVGLGGRVYEPSGTKVGFPDLISPAWMARTYGAVSIGVTDANGVASETRRIVGLAAGSQDTDAVNVAQLKLLDSKVNSIKPTYFAVKSTDTENQTNNGAWGNESIAIGPSAKATWENSLAIGKSTLAATDDGVALGSKSYNIVPALMRGYVPTSVSLTEDEKTSPTWRSTLGAVAIGITAEDSTGAITTATGTRQIVGLAAGTQDTDAVNVAQLKALGSTVDANKISFVSINEKSRGQNDNKDNDGATGEDAIAIGVFAAATAPNTTAMGQKAKATNYNAIALGDFANASGIGSTAVGDSAIASGHSTVAVGSESNATGMDSIALGREAKGTANQATAVGGEATASGINSLAAGFGSSAKGNFGSAFGSAATTDGDFATAAGYGAKATANWATALGEGTTADIAGGVALGSDSKTNITSGVLGYDPSDKITTQEILLGDNKDTYDTLQTEIATAQSNVSALAKQILDLQDEVNTADPTRQNEIIEKIKSLNTEFESANAALQEKISEANKLVSTWQATGAAVSVGNSETGLTRQITNVAAGSEDTDAVNVAQLTSLSDKVDANKISYVSINTKKEANKDNDQAGVPDDKSSRDAAVIGSNDITTGLGNWNLVVTGFDNTIKNISYDATADSVTEKLVHNTYVYGNENTASNGIAIGRRNVITGDSNSDNIAIGFNNKNYGERSVNLGNYTLTNGVDSIAVGFSAKAPVTDAIAIGSAAQANQVGAIVIGNGAVANTGGVALGYNSLADRSRGSIGYFTTLGSTEQAAIAEKLGKTTEYNQLVTIINGYSELAAQESQYRAYIRERQNNEDLLNAEKANLSKYAEGSAAYNTSLAKIREYQQKIKENNDGENSLSGIVSTSNPDYVNLLKARTELRNMFAAYMSTADAVSVGNVEKGIYRQITGVAAGSEDTDAVNVAQLKDMGSAGLDFKGDGETVVHRDLGEALNIVGGNTETTSLTDNNIGVVADDTTGTLNVKLAKSLTGLNSVKVGDDVTLDASGLTITNGPSVTKTGIDAVNQKITNVADGEANTDAVNVKQLKANKVTLTEGDNVTITSDVADDGSTNYTIKSTDTNTILSSGKVTYSGADGTLVLTDSTGKDVTVKGLKNTYLTGASLSNNTLTLNQNEGSPITVTGLATTTDIANNKIRYFSVNSTKTANENNDGATGEDAIAVGPNAIATNKHGIAIGNEVIVNGQEAIGIGSGIEPQYGKTIEKAPSYGSIAIGNKSWVDGKSERATVVGFNSVIQNSNRAVSLGSISFVDRSEAGVAIGYRSIITTSPFGVAIGSNDLGLFNSERGVVIGSNVFLNNSKNSILIGADSKTMDGQESSIGIGTTVKVKGDNSIAMGASASVMAESSMALGNRAKATESGGVAIGAYSVADRGALESGYNPMTDTTNGKIEDDATLAQAWGIQDKYSAALNKINSTEEGSEERTAAEKAMNELLSPYRSGYSAVSVGTSENTRQIINVAAGQADTDAVNVAQLKAAKVEVVAGTNIKTIDADTSAGYTKYTVNAIDTKVTGGSATYGTDGKGSITLNTDANGEKGTVTVSGLTDKYVDKVTFENNTLTIKRNDNESFTVDNLATKGDIATETGNVALNFAGDNADAKVTTKNKGTLNIIGGATATDADGNSLLTDNNLGVVKFGEDSLKVKLAKNLTGLNLVQLGNTVTINDSGFAIANGPSVKTDGINAGSKKITNVAAGKDDTDAVNMAQLNDVSKTVDKGWTLAVARGSGITDGQATVAGDATKITAGDTVTLQAGRGIKLNQDGSKVQIGLKFIDMDPAGYPLSDAVASGGASLAVGQNSVANGHQGTAVGFETRAGQYSFAGGTHAEADMNSVAIGNYAKANTTGSVAIGEGRRIDENDPAGGYKKIDSDFAVAIGDNTYVGEDSEGSNALGANAEVTGSEYGTALGSWSNVSNSNNAVAVGVSTSVSGSKNAAAIGAGAKVENVANGVALGSLAVADRSASVAGYDASGTDHSADAAGAWKSGLGAVSVGQTGYTRQITNVAAGSEDTDAVNVAQLKKVAEGADKATKDANLKFTGDDTSNDATITKKNGETLTIYGGVAAKDADGKSLLTDVNNVGVVKTDDGLQIKLAKNLSGIDSVRIGGSKADEGIYIANQTVTYTKDGQDGETVEGRFITGLENKKWDPDNKGIVSGRAATEDQLKAAYDSISSNVNANKVVAGKNIEVTPDKNGNGTTVALKDQITLGGETADNQVTIDGNATTITAGDGANKVAIDGSKAAITAGEGTNKVAIDGTKAAITAGEGANQVAVDGTNATVTAGTGDNKVTVDGTKGQVIIGEAGKGLVMGNQDVAVKNADGTDKVDENGNAVKDSGKYITGLDNTTWNPAEKGYVPDRAATEGQLKSVSDSVKNVTDTIGVGKRDFVGDETADDKKVGVKLGESLNLKGGADVSKLSDGNIGVVTNKDKNGFDIKLSKDLKDLNSVTSNTVTTKELTVSEKANIGNVSISNDNVTIGTGDSKTVITNESVTTNSVTTGNTTINNDGLTVKNEDSSKNITVQNNNVSMGGNVIHNVGDGVEASDAINKGQFDRTVNAIGTGMNQMSNRISKLDTRVDRVGAGAAALAALHPLEYNADEKWEISAGVGNYRGANAVAVGAFYRPNGNTLVSLGTSYGGGENMVNAGVTWRVGEGETGNYSSKQAMAQEISSLKSVVSDQSSQLQAQNSKIEAQSQQLEEQNKKIEQLMQAIAELKK